MFHKFIRDDLPNDYPFAIAFRMRNGRRQWWNTAFGIWLYTQGEPNSTYGDKVVSYDDTWCEPEEEE